MAYPTSVNTASLGVAPHEGRGRSVASDTSGTTWLSSMVVVVVLVALVVIIEVAKRGA